MSALGDEHVQPSASLCVTKTSATDVRTGGNNVKWSMERLLSGLFVPSTPRDAFASNNNNSNNNDCISRAPFHVKHAQLR